MDVSRPTLQDHLLDWSYKYTTRHVSVCLSVFANTVGQRGLKNRTSLLCKQKDAHVYLHIGRGGRDTSSDALLCQVWTDLLKTVHLWSDHPRSMLMPGVNRVLVGLDHGKRETTSEGRDEEYRGSSEKQDRWDRDQGPASVCRPASLPLFLTCLLPFNSGLLATMWDQMTLSLWVCLIMTAYVFLPPLSDTFFLIIYIFLCP